MIRSRYSRGGLASTIASRTSGTLRILTRPESGVTVAKEIDLKVTIDKDNTTIVEGDGAQGAIRLALY